MTEKQITRSGKKEKSAEVSLLMKYINEEFPGSNSQENTSISGMTHTIRNENAGWSGKGWGRRTPKMSTSPMLKDIDKRRAFMLFRNEGIGGLAYDRITGGVFQTNKRAHDLLRKTKKLLMNEKDELRAAFRKAGLQV